MYTDYFYGLPLYGGGGETYAIYMACSLAKEHNVTVFSNKVNDGNCNLMEVFGYYKIPKKIIDTIHFKYAPTIGWEAYRYKRECNVHKFLKKQISKNFDVFINCSDNTLRGLKQKNIKSIKINHFPWEISYPGKVPYSKFIYLNRYLNSYDLFLCNSKFTCKHHYKIHGKKANVLYPPINQKCISYKDIENKEDIILSVGRLIKVKKITEMVDVFKRINKQFSHYKLVLVGNYREEDSKYLHEIKQSFDGINYELICNANQQTLNNIYKKSKIFWSLKGLDEEDPINMEHFGMTTVEAMANGCVPIVCNKAGSKEIVNKTFGERINSTEQLYRATVELINNSDKLYTKSVNSIDASKKYLIPEFYKNLTNYL